ncbi:MAG: hypothetical protein WBC44_15940, partial [Planctomycetaceae bacterium]
MGERGRGGDERGGDIAGSPVSPLLPSRQVVQPAPAETASNRPTAASRDPSINFEAGCEADLLTELRSRADAFLQTHLAGVSRSAILGPNALELTFPTRYSRQYVDGPNGRGRVEELLAELTGQPVRLTCRLADDEPTTAAATTAAATTASRRRTTAASERRRSTEVPEDDEFVQKAVSIFEARVLRVTELGGSTGD